MKHALGCALLLLTASAGGADAAGRCGDHPWCDTSLDADTRAGLLLEQLTQDEKISLLAGDDLFGVGGQAGSHTGTSDGVPRVDLPTIYYTDGPMGVRSGMATAMPAPVGLAATWDPTLAARYGATVGNEAKSKGNDVVFAPTVNIMRTPLGGRTFEGYGEDPWLVGRMAVGWIEGAQSEGVIANVKHFAANNQEGMGPAPQGVPLGVGVLGDRYTVNAVVDERTLREIYLPAFEAAVNEANVGSIMCSYNRLNGQYACENAHLLETILRLDWGFEGYVLSDYGAAHPDGTAASLNDGLDFEPWPGWCYSPLQVDLALAASLASSATVDEHVRRILRTLFAYGAFDRDAYPYDDTLIDQVGHAAVAAEIEEAALTLLKNDGRVLPLDLEDPGLRSIAVIGADADAFQSRGGSAGISPFFYDTPLQVIRSRAEAHSATVSYADGSDQAAAAATAAAADVALVFVADISGEGADKPCMAIDCGFFPPRSQDALIDAVATANPNTIVVLDAGAPVLMPWRASVKAILAAWIPGESAGTAIADVVFGRDANGDAVDPGGRLPVTFPESDADIPTAGDPEKYPGVAENVYYKEGVLVGYRWYDANGIEPAFAFGHGLSYSDFAYGGLAVTPTPSGGVAVDFEVTNVGARPGSDVAQIYVGFPAVTGLVQPPKALKGFQKVALAAGASAPVHLELDARAFAYWSTAANDWRVAPGCYQILLGRSARAIVATASVPLGGGTCP